MQRDAARPARGRGRSCRPTRAGRAGSSGRAPCPCRCRRASPTPSPSANARLVDHLADDPPEHEPGRVADPRHVLAERREEALGARRRERRGSLRCASARPARVLPKRRQHVEADRAAARVERGRAIPARTARAARRRPRRLRAGGARRRRCCSAGRLAVAFDRSATAARRRSARAARAPRSPRPRRRRAELPGDRPVAGDHDTPSPRPPPPGPAAADPPRGGAPPVAYAAVS